MQSIENMLAYAKSQHRKVGYSMAYPKRLGPNYLDCSSFVYYALIAGGFLPQHTVIGNTESLYKLFLDLIFEPNPIAGYADNDYSQERKVHYLAVLQLVQS